MSVNLRFYAIYFALVAIVFGAGLELGIGMKTHTITKTKIVEKDWGKPDLTVGVASLAQQAASLTCDIYRAKSSAVCHP